jgi:hypothetical protein
MHIQRRGEGGRVLTATAGRSAQSCGPAATDGRG